MTPRRRVAPVPWAVLLRRDWDQLAQALLMIAFGVWGLSGARTTVSLSALGPGILVFDALFITVGLLLLYSLRANSWGIRRRAYVIHSLALVLLAALLVFLNPTPFIALALGFAFQGFAMVRNLKRQEQIALRVLTDPYEQTMAPVDDSDFDGRHTAR